MFRLYNWYLCRYPFNGSYVIVARGIVTGNPRFSDCKSIHTSEIASVKMEGDVAVVMTRNSVYYCDMKDADYDRFEVTDYIDTYEEYKERFSGKRKERDIPDTNQVYITLGNNREYYYDSVHINYEGRIELIEEPLVHLGMFQDSVLSRFRFDEKYVRFDYFPHRGMHVCFYNWDDKDFEVYVENCGDADLYVTVRMEVYRIEPGERKLIKKENSEKNPPTIGQEDLYGYTLL